MQWIILAVVLWFVLSRRRRRWYAHEHLHGCARGPMLRERHHYARVPDASPISAEMRAQRSHGAAAKTQSLSRFEQLKRRYVSGDLTDEQYEQQLDVLLREPGGMKEF